MFELIVRVVLASGAMAAAGVLGRPDFDLTWKAAVVLAAYSYLLYMLEQKGLRNPGVSGLAAVADCGIVAVLIADLGMLPQAGFVAAVPMVYAFWRFRSNAAMMAPLVCSWLLIGANLFGGGNAFTPMLLVQALGVLVLGVTLSQVRAARENRREAEAVAPVRTLEQLVQQLPKEEIPQEPGSQEYIELRESYRQLADSARDLEKRSRKDRACVQLVESALRHPRSSFSAIAARVQEITGAEGVGLYTVSLNGDSLLVRSTAGTVDQTVNEADIQIPKRTSEGEVTDRIKASLTAVRDPNTKSKFANVLLKVRGRIVGMLTLFHSSNIELEAASRRATESADFIAELVVDQVAREDERRRTREAELLYTVATTAAGATTIQSLAARVVRELADSLRLDHLSVWSVEDGQATRLAGEGTEHRIFEDVSYPEGKGAEGWLKSGCPVVQIANARTDSQEAVKRRIGAVLIVPLEFGADPFGFLMASVTQPNGIDQGQTETIRAVCAELSQAIARTRSGSRGPEGLATPKEFFETVQNGGPGHLVYLEVPQREELSETYGRPAIEHALRRLAVRLRSELPQGASLTRRNEGDFVAYIPSSDEDYVRRWANSATALSSLVALRTPDGRTRIPLGLMAKVAAVGPQLHRISHVKSA